MYRNIEDPFYPERTPPKRKAAARASNTYDLVARLTTPDLVVTPIDSLSRLPAESKTLKDVPARDLAFRYIDRELLLHRTTSPATWEDKSRNRGGIRIDLLLAVGQDPATAVVGELKIATDKDPFFALIQALAGVAHLATPNQYERLTKRVAGGKLFAPSSNPKLDAYVLFHNSPPDNADRLLCKRAADAFAQRVLTYDAIGDAVRRVAALDLDLRGERGVGASVRFACQRSG